MWGLIPARQGSKRVPNKNLIEIAGHPLVGLAVREALASQVFEQVICSTDSDRIAEVALDYGAQIHERKPEHATDTSPDIEWVNDLDPESDFAILRPTSPFRTAHTIRRAFTQFLAMPEQADSLRAVQPVSERPEKMWKRWGDKRIIASMASSQHDRLYECQAAGFSELFVQNGCIEIARLRVLPDSVSGDWVVPFFTEGFEGLDINTQSDVRFAQWVVEKGTHADTA